MDRKTIYDKLSRYGKQDFITQQQIAERFGASRWTIARRLKGVKAIDGKYFDIHEVAKALAEKIV
jgi:DNA-binding transcriptional regulator LsrR (DeoR family)